MPYCVAATTAAISTTSTATSETRDVDRRRTDTDARLGLVALVEEEERNRGCEDQGTDARRGRRALRRPDDARVLSNASVATAPL
jgi:hypothetical protein